MPLLLLCCLQRCGDLTACLGSRRPFPDPMRLQSAPYADDRGVQSSLMSLLSQYPMGSARFIAWAPSSQCGAVQYNTASWHWRKQCMAALVIAALYSQRYIVLADNMRDAYDVDEMAAWFPIVPSGKLSILAPGAALDGPSSMRLLLAAGTIAEAAQNVLHSLDLVRAAHVLCPRRDCCCCCCCCCCCLYVGLWPSHSPAVRQASAVRVRCRCLQRAVLLDGTPAAQASFAFTNFQVPSWCLQQLEMFIAPPPPPRPQFQCMRLGGPANPANRDPTCPVAPQSVRTSWDYLWQPRQPQ